MTLPVLKTPTYELTVPSTKEVIKYRPFLVKEEKILLMVKEAKDTKEILRAMKDIIYACTFEKVDPETLSLFDIEYIFMQLRAKSVGEKIELEMRCVRKVDDSKEECGGVVPFIINIDDIEVKFAEKHNNVIVLDEEEGVGITLRYPSISTVIDIDTTGDEVKTVAGLVENIFDTDNVYDAKDIEPGKIVEFIENLTKKQYEKIKTEFFDTIPVLEHTVTYKCPKCGQKGEYTFRGITDFF